MNKWTIKIEANSQQQVVEWLEILKKGFVLGDKMNEPLELISIEYGDESLICKLD